jgi:hypothetical protein
MWNGKLLKHSYPQLFSFAIDTRVTIKIVLQMESFQDIFQLPRQRGSTVLWGRCRSAGTPGDEAHRSVLNSSTAQQGQEGCGGVALRAALLGGNGDSGRMVAGRNRHRMK